LLPFKSWCCCATLWTKELVWFQDIYPHNLVHLGQPGTYMREQARLVSYTDYSINNPL
jgi:predicted alpha/beta hydrolase